MKKDEGKWIYKCKPYKRNDMKTHIVFQRCYNFYLDTFRARHKFDKYEVFGRPYAYEDERWISVDGYRYFSAIQGFKQCIRELKMKTIKDRRDKDLRRRFMVELKRRGFKIKDDMIMVDNIFVNLDVFRKLKKDGLLDAKSKRRLRKRKIVERTVKLVKEDNEFRRLNI